MSKHIAITGTKGKTTILYILDFVFREFNSNVYRISSTEGIYYNNEFIENSNISSYFRYFNNVYDYYLTEATSKMLSINKYDDYLADVGIYTGIEKNEHIDYHSGFDGYLSAKKKLFSLIKQNGFIVINNNDEYANLVTEDYNGKIVFVHDANVVPLEDDVYNYTIISISEDFMLFKIYYKNFDIDIKTKLLGKYNALNLTIAFATLSKLGFNKILIKTCLEQFNGIKGRFEKINLIDERKIIIDYAHTERSLKFIIENIKNIYNNSNLVTVFGCGGNRSTEKRGPMGKIATELSNFVILTDDNPRTENPDDIIKDIESGIITINYEVIHDRTEAIEKAIITYRQPGTIILIAGKGSEKNNIFDKFEYELTDRNRIEMILSKYNIYEI